MGWGAPLAPAYSPAGPFTLLFGKFEDPGKCSWRPLEGAHTSILKGSEACALFPPVHNLALPAKSKLSGLFKQPLGRAEE